MQNAPFTPPPTLQLYHTFLRISREVHKKYNRCRTMAEKCAQESDPLNEKSHKLSKLLFVGNRQRKIVCFSFQIITPPQNILRRRAYLYSCSYSCSEDGIPLRSTIL